MSIEANGVDDRVARLERPCLDVVEHRVGDEHVVAALVSQYESEDRVLHLPVKPDQRPKRHALRLDQDLLARPFLVLEPGVDYLCRAVPPTPPLGRSPRMRGLFLVEV